MSEEESSKGNSSMLQEESSKLDTIYKVLETILISEIILFILGGIIVTNMHPIPLQILYWMVIPWSTLISGVLFLAVRHLRRRVAS